MSPRPHPSDGVREMSDLDLSRLAVSALVEEAELSPKPALVDGRGSGAHHDLDLPRLRLSARSLRDGFAEIAQAAKKERPPLRLREELGRIGRDMEQRMMAVTDGSNAHRGAIWALGLLVAAAVSRSPRENDDSRPRKADRIATDAAVLARLSDRFAPPVPTHGENVRVRFGATGARGEAERGFPHAVRVGLPTLRVARARGIGETCARLDALMAIMATVDDTCLLHRGGRAALTAAQTGAALVLAAGGTAAPAGWARLHRLHEELMERWVSPGGSGDLLAVTLFLDRLEDGAHSSTYLSREMSHGDPELRL